MRIGEVAERTGVSVRSIRHYEQQGLVRAHRSPSGYREFDEAAVELVCRIRVLLRNGFTLEEIRSVAVDLDETNLGEVCEDVIALYYQKLQDLQERIRQIEAVQQRIQARLAVLEAQRRERQHREVVAHSR